MVKNKKSNRRQLNTPYDLYKQLMVMHHHIDPIAYPTKSISKKYFNEKLKSEVLVI